MRPMAVFMFMCAAAAAFAQDKPLVELPPPALEGPDGAFQCSKATGSKRFASAAASSC